MEVMELVMRWVGGEGVGGCRVGYGELYGGLWGVVKVVWGWCVWLLGWCSGQVWVGVVLVLVWSVCAQETSKVCRLIHCSGQASCCHAPLTSLPIPLLPLPFFPFLTAPNQSINEVSILLLINQSLNTTTTTMPFLPHRRGGLVGPWTAVAPLMALCTDPQGELAGRALRLLRTVCEQYPRYMDADRLCGGVAQAYAFQAALREVRGGGV